MARDAAVFLDERENLPAQLAQHPVAEGPPVDGVDGMELIDVFAFLTDLMSKTWSGLTTREYKKYKGLTKENLRDNMTNMELLLNALAEETATELSKQRNPEGLSENAGVAKEGAEVAKSARKEVEKRLGHSVVSPEKAIEHIKSPEELPFPEEQINDNS